VGRPHRILIAGGDGALLGRARAKLEERGHDVLLVDGAEASLRAFAADGADLVIACLPLRHGTGAELIRGLREIDPRVDVLVTGTDERIASAADAFALGAFEHVDDAASDMSDLLAAAGVALGSRRGDAQLRYLTQREATGSRWSAVVGESSEMREVVDLLRRVSERTSRGAAPTILLRGETGTGKGLIAKCIHYDGVRRNQPFVEINCAAIPATLLESELFGHERGAFTDARTSRAGLFETAHRGTLFLDEIGQLSFDLQAKLLTAIEEKRIRRIGGRQSVVVDVQIIAASHDDLAEKVKGGAFRADLYHRLNVVSVVVPPLRRRGNDKVILAEAFLASMCREYGLAPRVLGPEARAYVLDYAWPGNVRELKNQMERLVLLGDGEIVGAEDFARSSIAPPPSERPARAEAKVGPAAGAPEVFTLALHDDGVDLEQVERALIDLALQRFDGNVSQAARWLKISRQTLIYRIKKHGLET
jgi:DNA-binding NtrC family response regulator